LPNPPEADKFLRLPREMRSLFLWGQAQILILEILNVFLWLKFSPFLNLNKNEHFSKVSPDILYFYREAMTPFFSARSAEKTVCVGLCESEANYFFSVSSVPRMSEASGR
jgi:hypothetical protein